MLAIPLPLLPLPAGSRPLPPTARLQAMGEADSQAAREAWVGAFALRMGELRPAEDDGSIRALAAALWSDVGSHDPCIAAEMEYESSFGPAF